MNVHKKDDNRAVSPVIGVILMVSITVVMSGIVYVWATQLTDTEDRALSYYMFNFSLDSENDEILLVLESGPLVSSEYFNLKIDGNEASIPVQGLVAGEVIPIESPFDMVYGKTYNVKLVNSETVIWDEDYVAGAI